MEKERIKTVWISDMNHRVAGSTCPSLGDVREGTDLKQEDNEQVELELNENLDGTMQQAVG